MTKLLERALAAVEKLPEKEQDVIAAVILDEIEDERRWDEKFRSSQDALARLADEAIKENRAGETRELDPEEF